MENSYIYFWPKDWSNVCVREYCSECLGTGICEEHRQPNNLCFACDGTGERWTKTVPSLQKLHSSMDCMIKLMQEKFPEWYDDEKKAES